MRGSRARSPRQDGPGFASSSASAASTLEASTPTAPSGGYRALARALELGPAGVIDEVVASKLVGRGGAAFPTGRKWDAVAKAPARPHYLVCNADESEPGTFKDRLLMEEDPFAVVEGMTIAGYATGCERGYLYLRGEYPLAAERMAGAIEAARAARAAGRRPCWAAGFAFDIEIRRGAGAYICGEETALFNSIEGKRGEPRNKPPFPVQVGLFGTAHRGEQRGDARERARPAPRGRRRLRAASAPAARPDPSCSASRARSPAPASTRPRSASRCASLLELAAASDGRRSRGAPGRRGRRLRGTGQARRPADLRGHPRDRRHPRLGRRHGLRRDARPASTSSGVSPRSSATSRAASACPAASGTVRQEELLARLRAARRWPTPTRAGAAARDLAR